MTTNTRVSIAMTPVKPPEDRERAVIGGCVEKDIGLRFRCHAQILTGIGVTDDRSVCLDPASTDGSRFPTTGVIRKDRDASFPVGVPIIIVLLHRCK
jgi:hypothetical protein